MVSELTGEQLAAPSGEHHAWARWAWVFGRLACTFLQKEYSVDFQSLIVESVAFVNWRLLVWDGLSGMPLCSLVPRWVTVYLHEYGTGRKIKCPLEVCDAGDGYVRFVPLFSPEEVAPSPNAPTRNTGGFDDGLACAG